VTECQSGTSLAKQVPCPEVRFKRNTKETLRGSAALRMICASDRRSEVLARVGPPAPAVACYWIYCARLELVRLAAQNPDESPRDVRTLGVGQGVPERQHSLPRIGRLLAGSMGMTEPAIDRFMTKGLHTIGHDQTLAAAHGMMQEHSIRHLPVLDAGKLVGILSLRDLHFIETLQDTDPELVQVSEAMSQDVFAIGPRSSVRKVAAEMAEHKYGSAVIIDQGRVVGIFTTVDALQALSSLLDEQRPPPARANHP